MPYWYRCDKSFGSERALEQHIDDSRNHHVCTLCNEDVRHLTDHYEEAHNYCTICGIAFKYFRDFDEHEVNVHNKCQECESYFDSQNSLTNHRRVHATRDVECFGCTRTFDRNSAMLLHLEARTCESGHGIETVNQAAFDAYHLSNWVVEDFKLQCPTCAQYFTKMSAIMQHVESDRCDEDVNGMPIEDFLDNLRDRVSQPCQASHVENSYDSSSSSSSW